MEALLHQRSVRMWVAPGNVGSRTRLPCGLSGVHTQSNPADSLTRPGWESAALRMALSLMRSFVSANVQRTSSSFCQAATSGGSSEPQI